MNNQDNKELFIQLGAADKHVKSSNITWTTATNPRGVEKEEEDWEHDQTAEEEVQIILFTDCNG